MNSFLSANKKSSDKIKVLNSTTANKGAVAALPSSAHPRTYEAEILLTEPPKEVERLEKVERTSSATKQKKVIGGSFASTKNIFGHYSD